MRILLLSEGDPETLDSWSGSSRGLIRALRSLGHSVLGRNVSEAAWARWLGIVSSWAPTRARWGARYHFGPVGFRARTARARATRSKLQPPVDAALQIGATFDAVTGFPGPGVLYCDSNVHVAARNAPYGDAAALTPGERARMARRERTVYTNAAAIFAMSDYVRQSFVREFGIPENRAVVVYAGANLDLERVVPRPSLPSGPPTVLFVGRLWGAKGGPVLLEAFRQVRERLSDARLRIVGCTPDVAAEAGVEVIGRIAKDAPGAEARLSALYRSADVFCMPSHFDAFGIVFVEAMLHGVACIGTDRAAIPEIIGDGVTGWLVPDGDVVALRDRLAAALASRQTLVTMGLRGRERALRLFTWERVAHRIAAGMEAVLARRPPLTVDSSA